MKRVIQKTGKRAFPGHATVLLITALMLFLSGCHGSVTKEEFTVPEQFDETKPIELTFWAKNDTNMNQVNIYNEAALQFQKLYPNVTVNVRFYTDYGSIYNDVITNISTGTTPNVCITYPDHIATYKTGKQVVQNLDELAADEEYGLGGSRLKFDSPSKKEVTDRFFREGILDGRLYALPFMRSSEACYINKDMVEKLGYEVPEVLTWDFVFEVSEAAMKKDADGNFLVNGQKVLIPFLYKSTDNMLIQLTKQKGIGYATEDGDILLFNDDTKKLLYEIASHAATGAFSTFKISGYPANFLNAGQCIFAVDSTAGSTWMGSKAPLVDIAEDKIASFETVVREVPQADPAHPQMISQGPSVCVFYKEDPQEVLASWLFAQYLLTNEVQIAYSATEGYIPVTEKAIQSPQYQAYLNAGDDGSVEHYPIKLLASKLIIRNTDNTFVTPVYLGSASLRDAAGALVESVTKSARRKETIDEAYMEKLFSDTRNLYRLDQTGESGSSRQDLGPLPTESKILLITLAVCWIGFLIYYLRVKSGQGDILR